MTECVLISGQIPVQTAALQDTIKIGETLTVLVYLKDKNNEYDIRVRDCWAYDSDDYTAPGTSSLQLTDDEGCPR
jgi:Tfp pilus assembly protein PilZ